MFQYKTYPVNVVKKECDNIKIEKYRNIQIKKGKKGEIVFTITLPKKWLLDMGVNALNKELYLQYKDTKKKGKRIIIRKASDIYEDDED